MNHFPKELLGAGNCHTEGAPAPHRLYKRDIHTRHNVRWLGLSLRTLLGCIGPDGVRMSLLRLP
jgi:hypothetical protein